ncbi:ABC transporter substrate-binding protein [Marinobacterium arenosum]|uniref:ABC transporter substrate-binding protein n=1 Tax=Marinobacterium arenosum TaxID=2862496 RepID=UPI001C96FC57|nr:ABC transporter substrate-binding protein [Marinobacterium arenosum]MBY4677005.1 ABC transporter substrate-binding protein [Marinobacterium arenosum]
MKYSATLLLSLTFSALLSSSTVTADSQNRLERIKSANQLRVCIWPDYFSITYRNPRTQQLEGIDIDMAKAFADQLGVKLKFVDSSFSHLAQNLKEDRCDIAMHGVGVRESRQPHMDFTQPHLVSGIYAVSDKNNPHIQQWSDIDQPGHIVVVQKGTYMEPVMKDYLQQAELSVVDNFKAREQEVESGRADLFMTDYPYGRRMTSLTTWAQLMAPPTAIAPTPYAYAVPKGEPEWLAVADKFVATVKADGRLRAAAERHGLGPIVAE